MAKEESLFLSLPRNRWRGKSQIFSTPKSRQFFPNGVSGKKWQFLASTAPQTWARDEVPGLHGLPPDVIVVEGASVSPDVGREEREEVGEKIPKEVDEKMDPVDQEFLLVLFLHFFANRLKLTKKQK